VVLGETPGVSLYACYQVFSGHHVPHDGPTACSSEDVSDHDPRASGCLVEVVHASTRLLRPPERFGFGFWGATSCSSWDVLDHDPRAFGCRVERFYVSTSCPCRHVSHDDSAARSSCDVYDHDPRASGCLVERFHVSTLPFRLPHHLDGHAVVFGETPGVSLHARHQVYERCPFGSFRGT
jgi:hypothetical protein